MTSRGSQPIRPFFQAKIEINAELTFFGLFGFCEYFAKIQREKPTKLVNPTLECLLQHSSINYKMSNQYPLISLSFTPLQLHLCTLVRHFFNYQHVRNIDPPQTFRDIERAVNSCRERSIHYPSTYDFCNDSLGRFMQMQELSPFQKYRFNQQKTENWQIHTHTHTEKPFAHIHFFQIVCSFLSTARELTMHVGMLHTHTHRQ